MVSAIHFSSRGSHFECLQAMVVRASSKLLWLNKLNPDVSPKDCFAISLFIRTFALHGNQRYINRVSVAHRRHLGKCEKEKKRLSLGCQLFEEKKILLLGVLR